ncbi:MAG: hypothetical protein EOP88_08315 [Verrucomicrobiaceae bacterium]|nr:MAG: hypothetical protein EOP88_08315 [Verrucomicrobiaceae bacterium]
MLTPTLSKNIVTAAASLAILAPSLATAASYAVISTGKTEVVGSSSAVPGGGSSSNFSSGTVTLGTTAASFRLVLSGTSTRFADMRITVVGISGTLDTTGSASGMMIAQTSNSQGLTDTGTISVLTGFSSTGTGGTSSTTLRFTFFEPDSLIPKSVALELTSFDFDYNQFIQVNNSDFTHEAHGSRLTKTTNSTAGTTTWADTKNSDSTFTDSRNAVVLNNVADSSFDLTVGKQGTGNSLFMFEFRDPSQILDTPLTPTTLGPAPIPEPTAAVLGGFATLVLLMRRRK